MIHYNLDEILIILPAIPAKYLLQPRRFRVTGKRKRGKVSRGGGYGTMYIEWSMKEKGILVTQSNQKPEREERLCRASASRSSQY